MLVIQFIDVFRLNKIIPQCLRAKVNIMFKGVFQKFITMFIVREFWLGNTIRNLLPNVSLLLAITILASSCECTLYVKCFISYQNAFILQLSNPYMFLRRCKSSFNILNCIFLSVGVVYYCLFQWSHTLQWCNWSTISTEFVCHFYLHILLFLLMSVCTSGDCDFIKLIACSALLESKKITPPFIIIKVI